MQYDICHPYILTEMKSRIIFQNGFQTDEEAIISNLTLTKKAWKFLGNPWIFLGKFPRNPRNPRTFKSLEKEQTPQPQYWSSTSISDK